ncbi:MAG: ion transporter [Gammaproteobacteria bacterium]|nr:ion transporter [Gammaproteobacteria bacterium]
MTAYRQRIAKILEQNAPDNKISKFVNWALILLISLNTIAIILESVQSIHLEYQDQFRVFEIFSVIIFSIEYVIRVWCSIDLTQCKDSSPILGRIKYMLSPMALIDLVAIVPFYLSLYLSFDLRFLRVLRMLRLFKITRYSTALSALLDVIQKESEALIAAIVVLMLMLIISASGIYLLESDLQPDVFGSIPDAMWWAMVTLTTVGYGDTVPITALGKIFGGLIGLIGVGMVALPAAIMASGFAENLNQRKQKYNHFIKHIISDGHIDEKERWELEELRKQLGLNPDDAIQLMDAVIRAAKPLQISECPHCGKNLERRKIPQG